MTWSCGSGDSGDTLNRYGWIPKPASKPTSAKRAGIPPAPPGATGSKPFEKKKDWKDNKSELLYSLSPSSSFIDPNLLSVTLSSFPKKTSIKARGEALLDTSSLAGGFHLGEDSKKV